MAEKSSPPDAKLMRLNDEHLRAAEPDAAATSRPRRTEEHAWLHRGGCCRSVIDPAPLRAARRSMR